MTSQRTQALVFGLLAAAVLSSTLTVAGLKAGISPGVSPLVVLIAWAAFARRLRGSGTGFLNVAQVAGSGGMAVTAGVIFTAPLLQILAVRRASPGLAEYEALRADAAAATGAERAALLERLAVVKEQLLAATPAIDVPLLMGASVVGALIGFGFVGLTTRRFLSDPSLPAPEARACRTLIDAAVEHPDRRPRLAPSLFGGVLAAVGVQVAMLLGAAQQVFHGLRFTNVDQSREGWLFNLNISPIYIGIGGLLTLPTALAVFAGGVVHAIAGSALATIDPSTAADSWAVRFPDRSVRWIGGAAMTVAVVYSLYNFVRAGRAFAHERGTGGDDDRLLDLRPGQRGKLTLSIALGALALATWLFAADGATPFGAAILPTLLAVTAVMVVLGALLSLQVGSSASPVSGTIFVTTLVLCVVAAAMGRRSIDDVALLMPLIVTACVAVCAANDSSQDYRTLHLCGMPPRDAFVAQFLGLLVGALVVPPALFVAHEAYVLGSSELPAPQGDLFAKVVDGLLLGGALPWWPIGVGAVLGLAAVAVEIVGRRRGHLVPSMALAVGMYLPPYLGVGILIGALARRAGSGAKAAEGHRGTLTAAGLVTGAAGYELVLGVVLLVTGASASAFELDRASWPGWVPALVGLGGLGLVLFSLYANGRADRSSDRYGA